MLESLIMRRNDIFRHPQIILTKKNQQTNNKIPSKELQKQNKQPPLVPTKHISESKYVSIAI